MRKLDLTKPSFGTWITIASPTIAEIMAQAGFDWITIDMEHSVISPAIAQQMIQTIEHYSTVPLVRVPENHPTHIKWAMDAGAYGVIVPFVNTAEEAARAVASVKYPPIGTRGVGLARAQKYGQGFSEYKSCVNRESMVIVQIEHWEAVENIEAILMTPGIDGFMVGPYDLSGSLGVPGDFSHPSVEAALQRVYAVAKRLGVPSGYHVIQPDIREINVRLQEGCTFIALSLDSIYLGNASRALLRLCYDSVASVSQRIREGTLIP